MSLIYFPLNPLNPFNPFNPFKHFTPFLLQQYLIPHFQQAHHTTYVYSPALM